MDPKDFLPHFTASRGGIRFPTHWPMHYKRNDIVVYTSYDGGKYVAVVFGMGEGWLQDMVKVRFWNEEKKGFLEETGIDPERLELVGSLTQLGVSLDD